MMFGVNKNKRKPQKRCNVTFRENEKEMKLYKWIQEKGEVGGVSNFIKTELYKIMELEEQGE
ncbi:MAG: hypothetical protein SOW47_13585 [Clostridium perfringens]|nr:hypothetical protein [Clostridium perfringens]